MSTPSLTTTRGRIERAEKALRTGQPGLAMTYMHAARNSIHRERRDRAHPAARALMDMAEAIKRIGDAAAELGVSTDTRRHPLITTTGFEARA